jgi:hypothetical protein
MPIALELSLHDNGDGSVWGRFAFSSASAEPSGVNGSFYIWGVKHSERRKVELIAGPWIHQPNGWPSLNLTGDYVLGTESGRPEATGEIKGRVLAAGCQEFVVHRLQERVATTEGMPPELRAKLQSAGYGHLSNPASSPPASQPQARTLDHPSEGPCTAEQIAGTYRSIAGDIICKPVGSHLECCYGGASCQKMLHLGVTPNGRSLSGEWEHRGRQKGPAEFALTGNCELSHGRWGFAANRMNHWRVVGRK